MWEIPHRVDWATNPARLVASAVALHGAGAAVISWVLLCFLAWCLASRTHVKLLHSSSLLRTPVCVHG